MTGRGLREPVGSVRVAPPVPLGLCLSDRIGKLLDRYAELSIELVMRDHPGSLVEDRLDLAVVAGIGAAEPDAPPVGALASDPPAK